MTKILHLGIGDAITGGSGGSFLHGGPTGDTPILGDDYVASAQVRVAKGETVSVHIGGVLVWTSEVVQVGAILPDGTMAMQDTPITTFHGYVQGPDGQISGPPATPLVSK